MEYTLLFDLGDFYNDRSKSEVFDLLGKVQVYEQCRVGETRRQCCYSGVVVIFWDSSLYSSTPCKESDTQPCS